MTKGYFTFVLHSHLPYVLSHGKWPHGTDWLNEATAETYLPILGVLNRLADEGVKPLLTLGITPILAEQLASESFKDEFQGYLDNKISISTDDLAYYKKVGEPRMAALATMWKDWYSNAKSDFVDRYGRNLIAAFKSLQDRGEIEIITCAATHGYLPLLLDDKCVNAQIEVGVKTYMKHFGRRPRGIWLPECAYRPAYNWTPPIESFGGARPRKGLEEFLYEHGVSYFIVDSHLLSGGKAIGAYLERFGMLKQLFQRFAKEYAMPAEGEPKSPYDVYLVASSDETDRYASILTRDPRTGLQVWSGEYGYPGDGHYLDFHKKKFPGGNRYWRVTHSKADLADKEVYDPSVIEGRVRENAEHFVGLATSIINEHYTKTGRQGLVCAPFDAELLGHWWFEGPRWLYHVLKGFSKSPDVALTTGAGYLDKFPPRQVIRLPEGSWGEGGYHWIWLNEWTQWTWKHVYDAETKMAGLVEKHSEDQDGMLRRLLTQLGRELLLLESSDWQFLISTWAARDYAEMRLSEHSSSFIKLYDVTERYIRERKMQPEDLTFLGDLEGRDAPFQDLDIKAWR